ncbi:MAG: flavin monoamine oxidase family protein [Bosea sp. (in: a-proteobacteria)]
MIYSPTRRAALRGGIASAALLGMSARLFAADVDVLIVGAGAAGISAAREFQRLGLSFRLIEARDRIGGRAFTDTSLGVPFDAGAEIIHFAEANPWVEIARNLKIELDASGGRMGGWQVFSNGKPLGILERGRRWQAFREMEARMTAVERSGRDVSLAEAVADLEPEQRDIARSGLLLVLGEDGERISVLDNQQLWNGGDYTTNSGYGALVAAYGRDLPVSLAVRAETIRWGQGGVEAETSAGTIRARAAIITVPVGVLKSGAIRFVPELPISTQTALAGISMGALTKIALKLNGERFELNDSTTLMDGTRSEAMTMIEMLPEGRPLAVAICGGDFARGLGAAGEAAAVAHLTDTLVGMLGSSVRRAVTGGRLASWWADPLSQGAYSVCLPGQSAARAALAEPVAARLWFAGEATAGGGSMTVGGATLSARKATAACAALLKT